MIETSAGKTKDVLTQLCSHQGVQTADSVTGSYDVVAVVEADWQVLAGDR